MDILIQILFLILVSNAYSSCPKGPEKAQKTGQLESELNENGFYLNNKNCIWKIYTLTGHFFFFEFDHFVLARRWGSRCVDFLKITDNNKKKILFHRCGNQSNPQLQSDSNNITIQFQTDNIQSNKTGFKLRWRSIERYKSTIQTTEERKVTKQTTISKLSIFPINKTTHQIVQSTGHAGGSKTKPPTTKQYTTIFKSTFLSGHTNESEAILSSTQISHIRTSSFVDKNSKTSYPLSTTNEWFSSFSHETSTNAVERTQTRYILNSTNVTGSNAKIYTTSADSDTETDGFENATTGMPDINDDQPPLFLIGIVIGGILIETIVVSVACTFCRKRKQKRWKVKTLSRTRYKNEEAQAWWSRPKSLSLSYNERLSLGNLYSEINIQEMISFQTDDTTATNTELNKCPYEEMIRRDGEYDHIGKHREKRKSFLDKLNVYGLQRISNIFKDN